MVDSMDGLNHTAQEWADRLGNLKRSGNGAFNGPCPLCGGRDRFHMKDGQGHTLVGCRGCLDGAHDGARFGNLMRTVWGEGPMTAPQMARVNSRPTPHQNAAIQWPTLGVCGRNPRSCQTTRHTPRGDGCAGPGGTARYGVQTSPADRRPLAAIVA